MNVTAMNRHVIKTLFATIYLAIMNANAKLRTKEVAMNVYWSSHVACAVQMRSARHRKMERGVFARVDSLEMDSNVNQFVVQKVA
jgi:hypothetical protein